MAEAAERPVSGKAPAELRRLVAAVPADAAHDLPGGVQPLALAAADLDGDGIADLLCGYADGAAGVLVAYRGNADAIYPNSPEARRRKAQGRFTDSAFLGPARVVPLVHRPDFLAAGDFDNDGRTDVIAAERGGSALSFLSGDTNGRLKTARAISLPGKVTTLAAGEVDRADGLPDLAIGLLGREGARMRLLRGPEGAMAAEPEDLPLPASAEAAVIASLDAGYPGDIAVVAGTELLVFSGRDNLSPSPAASRVPARRGFDSPLVSLAAGDFTGDHSADLAVLSQAGRIHIVEFHRETFDKGSNAGGGDRRKLSLATRTVEFDDGFAQEPAGEGFLSPLRLPGRPRWIDGDSCEAPAGSSRLLAARLSGGRGMDLVVRTASLAVAEPDSAAWLFPAASFDDGAAPAKPLSLDLSAATAILPMRLNGDAIDDLVVLGGASIAPSAVMSQAAATFNVNSAGDGADCNTSDSVCATSSGGCPNGPCTLRAAMMQANSSAGTDVITFAIGSGPATINPTSFLPILTGPVTIDGTTQPGYAGSPIIEIDGTGAGNPANGLTVDGGSSTIRGLVINKFTFRGVEVRSAGNIVEGNYFGINVAGTTGKPNALDGILVNNAPNNTIGGTTAAARNVSSGNNGDGIQIFGPAATGNVVQGNRFGTNPAGNAGLGNGVGSPCSSGAPGQGVSLNSAPNNTVGGTAAGARNLISGNLCDGVIVSGPAAGGNLIQGNFIGTDAAGTSDIGNAANAGGGGIRVVAPSTTVGGTAAGARNVISGNFEDGVEIPRPDMPGNVVLGNYIGTDATGAAPLGNEVAGILLPQTPGVQVGGTTAASRNVVSGNVFGIVIFAGASNVHVEGNYVGMAADGTTGLGNLGDGIFITGATSNFIGGTVGVTTGGACTGSCNVIAGNGDNGVLILGPSTTQNVVAGNRIGTDRTGAAAVPNTVGVLIDGAADNVIGGLSAAAGNVISGNASFGVAIANSGATGNRVQANTIGRTASGASPLPNGASGVLIQDANDNFVGIRVGDTVAAGNLIASNAHDGVRVIGTSLRDRIRANRIHSNTGLGIDLAGDGVTANDINDADSGPNSLMNFPEQISVNYDSTANETYIGGRVTSPSPTSITVDLYANQFEDPLRHGEGEVYLGSVTPNSDGSFCFTLAGQIPLPVGPPAPKVTATATDASGSTSEFSSTRFDVELIGLEVVQATQDLANNVKLVKGKQTWVRAHLQQRDPATGPRVVEGQLRGFTDAGAELAGSPLTPANFGVFRAGLNAVDRRGNFWDSLNFRLPDAWLDGTIRLRFERTNGDLMCKEPAEGIGAVELCADCGVRVTFDTTNPFHVAFVNVKWKFPTPPNAPLQSYASSMLEGAARALEAAYPIAALNWTEREINWGTRPITKTYGPDEVDVANVMQKIWLLDDKPKRVYFGSITGAGTPAGYTVDLPAFAAAGYFPRSLLGIGRHTPTHEVGHAVGRHHSTNAANPTVPNSWPPPATYAQGSCNDLTDNPPASGYFPNFHTVTKPSYLVVIPPLMPTLGDMTLSKDKWFFGMDTALTIPRALDPNEYFDFMSYCANLPLDMWSSKFTYEGVQTRINGTFPASGGVVRKSGVTQDYLVFTGEIDWQNDVATLKPFFRLSTSSAPPPEPPGDFVLRLLNGSGGLIQDISFQPLHGHARGPVRFEGAFFIPVPANPAIRRAVVLRNGVELASRSASANAPAVLVLSPNGGENLTGDPITITWAANDADGDPLTFDVEYSRDGGAAWTALVVDWNLLAYSVARSALAGSTTALFRVTASDGFLTARDQSDAVCTIPNRGPDIYVRTPSQNQLFIGLQQIAFDASSGDAEDGQIPVGNFQWSSSINGTLGSGKLLLKRADQLSPGVHTITVTGTDSQGVPGSANVTIRIGSSLPPAYADLSLNISGLPDPVRVGNNLIYNLTVDNTGADTATGITLTDTLPAGVNFVSATPSQGNCGQASGVVTCNLGTLADHTAATVTIVVMPTAAGSLENQATVTTSVEDPIPANNTLTLTSTVTSLSQDFDLSIAKSDSPDPVAPSGTLTYTLSVSNLGAGNTTNLTVTDTLPGAVAFQSASGSGWSCGHSSGTVTCTRDGLASGAGPPITILVTAPATTGPITNNASVSAAEADSVTSNNSASATTSVGGNPGASAFHTVAPCRVADTRNPVGAYGGPALSAGSVRTFTVGGQCGIPVSARAVSFNITITGPTSLGHLSLYPGGTTPPLVSTINFRPGQTRANNAIVPLGAGGTLAVSNGQGTGTVELIIDVNGYFE